MLDASPALKDWGILPDSVPYPASWNSFGSLWFAGPDLYRKKDKALGGDPREGTFPIFNLDDDEICRVGAERMRLTPKEAEERKQKYMEWNHNWLRGEGQLMTRLCGVTCWYNDTQECDKMWSGYVGANPGVVVKTTMKRLEESLRNQAVVVHDRAGTSSEVQAGMKFNQALRIASPLFTHAKYINLDEVFEADDGYRAILRLKGDGFRHENEVRGIARSPRLEDRSNERLSSLSKSEVDGYLETSPGFNLSVNLDTLLEEVRVSPGSPDSYLDEVRELLAQTGLKSVVICRSDFDSGKTVS